MVEEILDWRPSEYYTLKMADADPGMRRRSR